MATPFSSQVARAGMWSVFRTSIREGIAFFVFLILARFYLGDEEFGLVALANSFMAFCQEVSRLGLATALIQKSDVTDEDCDTVFWVSTGLIVLLSGVFIVLAPYLAAWVNEPELAPILRALTPGVVLATLGGVHDALLAKKLEFRQLALRSLLAGIIGGAIGVGAAMLGWGVWSLVALNLSMALVNVVCVWMAHPWRPRFRFSTASFRELFATGIGVSGIGLLGYFYQHSDKLLLGFLVSVTQLGQYFLAQRLLRSIMDLLARSVSHVALPGFAQLADDRERVRRGIVVSSRIIAVFSFPLLIGLALIANQLVGVLLGDEWLAAGEILIWLCVGSIPQILMYSASPVLIALGHTKKAFNITFVGVGVLLLASAGGTRFGPVGVAIGVGIANLVMLFYVGRLIGRVTGMTLGEYAAAIAPATGSVAVMAVAVIAAREAGAAQGISDYILLPLEIGVGGLVYILAMLWSDPSIFRFVSQNLMHQQD